MSVRRWIAEIKILPWVFEIVPVLVQVFTALYDQSPPHPGLQKYKGVIIIVIIIFIIRS